MDRTPETRTRLLDVAALQEYLSIGRNNALRVGKESGALRKIGKKNLYDRQQIDRYVDSLGK